jgi:hypothetical protein
MNDDTLSGLVEQNLNEDLCHGEDEWVSQSEEERRGGENSRKMQAIRNNLCH